MWGVVVTIKRLISWWHIPGTSMLEYKAAADGLLNDHIRLHKEGKQTRKQRGTILALCLAALIIAAILMVVFARRSRSLAARPGRPSRAKPNSRPRFSRPIRT